MSCLAAAAPRRVDRGQKVTRTATACPAMLSAKYSKTSRVSGSAQGRSSRTRNTPSAERTSSRSTARRAPPVTRPDARFPRPEPPGRGRRRTAGPRESPGALQPKQGLSDRTERNGGPRCRAAESNRDAAGAGGSHRGAGQTTLADARLALHGQHPAVTGRHRAQQLADRRSLIVTPHDSAGDHRSHRGAAHERTPESAPDTVSMTGPAPSLLLHGERVMIGRAVARSRGDPGDVRGDHRRGTREERPARTMHGRGAGDTVSSQVRRGMTVHCKAVGSHVWGRRPIGSANESAKILDVIVDLCDRVEKGPASAPRFRMRAVPIPPGHPLQPAESRQYVENQRRPG